MPARVLFLHNSCLHATVWLVDRGGRGSGCCCKFDGASAIPKKENGLTLLPTFPKGKKVNLPKTLPKTDTVKIRELKDMLLKSGGKNVVQKVIDIALDDGHPGQMAALKMCMDRTLPTSLFDKEKGQRSAVTINITGIGDAPTIIEAAPGDVTDV